MLTRLRPICILLTAFSALTACTNGPLDVSQTTYLSYSDEENTAYLRVRAVASTRFSDARFRQGWFSAEAVDSLFGEVSSEASINSVLVRDRIRQQIDNALVSTTEKYVDEVLKDKPDETILKRRLRQRYLARLIQEPSRRDQQTGARLIEYNPAKGLDIDRSDQKLVFFLSANPDEIIGEIANFSENESTTLAVHKFADIFVQQKRNEVVALKAEDTERTKTDRLVASQIDIALTAIRQAPTLAQAREQIEILNQLVLALER